jgi:hypothetical protein
VFVFKDSSPLGSEEKIVPQSIEIGSIIASQLNNGPQPTFAFAHDVTTTGLNVRGEMTKATQASVQEMPRNVVAPTAIITHNAQTLTPVPVSQFVIRGQTLTAGGETAIWSQSKYATKIHLNKAGSPVLVLEDRTSTVTQITPAPTVISGQTLSMGGLPIYVDSERPWTTLSINAAGETIGVVEGVRSTIAPPSAQVVEFGSDVTATLQRQGYSYLVEGSTLNLDHPVTVSGTILSLTTNNAGSTLLVAGNSTTTISSPAQVTNGVSSTIQDAVAITRKKSIAAKLKERNMGVSCALAFAIAVFHLR